jgi:hypothetical protein
MACNELVMGCMRSVLVVWRCTWQAVGLLAAPIVGAATDGLPGFAEGVAAGEQAEQKFGSEGGDATVRRLFSSSLKDAMS